MTGLRNIRPFHDIWLSSQDFEVNEVNSVRAVESISDPSTPINVESTSANDAARSTWFPRRRPGSIGSGGNMQSVRT